MTLSSYFGPKLEWRTGIQRRENGTEKVVLSTVFQTTLCCPQILFALFLHSLAQYKRFLAAMSVFVNLANVDAWKVQVVTSTAQRRWYQWSHVGTFSLVSLYFNNILCIYEHLAKCSPSQNWESSQVTDRPHWWHSRFQMRYLGEPNPIRDLGQGKKTAEGRGPRANWDSRRFLRAWNRECREIGRRRVHLPCEERLRRRHVLCDTHH